MQKNVWSLWIIGDTVSILAFIIHEAKQGNTLWVEPTGWGPYSDRRFVFFFNDLQVLIIFLIVSFLHLFKQHFLS